MALLIDPVFGLDDFNKPDKLVDNDVIVNTLLIILFGKPGFYPAHPTLGMNIQQYFTNFKDELNPTQIQAGIAMQCEMLSEHVMTNTITVDVQYNEEDKPILLITCPTTEKEGNNIIVIGITSGSDGTIRYNYELMSSALIK